MGEQWGLLKCPFHLGSLVLPYSAPPQPYRCSLPSFAVTPFANFNPSHGSALGAMRHNAYELNVLQQYMGVRGVTWADLLRDMKREC